MPKLGGGSTENAESETPTNADDSDTTLEEGGVGESDTVETDAEEVDTEEDSSFDAVEESAPDTEEDNASDVVEGEVLNNEEDNIPGAEEGDPVETTDKDVSETGAEEQDMSVDELMKLSVDERLAKMTSDNDIASGTINNVAWVINADGKLIVVGTGEFLNGEYAPWHDNRYSIKSAEINLNSAVSTSRMFYDCTNLSKIDLSGLDTTNVTNMSEMFYGCNGYGLTNLDISNFDTTNVTDMSGMFYGCRSYTLTSLDVSNFDTTNVTDMSEMFRDCYYLTSLDVSNFDTTNVTDMSEMFRDCSYLTSLDVSNFDTANVADMSGMFHSCRNLTSLDVSNFDTTNVTDMNYMFEGCESLTSLDVSNFDTTNVTDMNAMFEGCESLTSLDMSSFDTMNVTNMYWVFADCNSLKVINTPKNVKTSVELPGIWLMPDGEEITELPIDLSESVEITKSAIANGTNENIIWSIDANGKLTVDGSGEFLNENKEAPWSQYSELIISAEVNLTGTVNAANMFKGLKNLESADLRGFDTTKVTDMSRMFSECESLTKLNLSNFSTTNVTDMSKMFYYCKSLTDLDVSSFDTTNVTDMSGMFSYCEGLIRLDLSNFDTRNVTNMSDMFGCRSLRSLDVSNFDTANVTDMRGMFSICESLTSLDVSNFDTANVTDMSGMFSDCYSLASLDLSNFDTANVTDMSGMFNFCESLISLDVSSFNTTKVTDMSEMFFVCRSLTSLDVSNFNTTNVTNMNSMFSVCESLISLDLSNFDTTNVTDMGEMFSESDSTSGNGFISLDLSSFNTTNVTDMSGMFRGCYYLTSLDLSNFDTSNVTNMGWMFESCRSLTSLDLSNFDTRNVTNMYCMFYDCKGLTSLDLSSFDTMNVTTMDWMFESCSSLTSLDLSSFDTTNVTSMDGMFYGCIRIKVINTPKNVAVSAALPKGTWLMPDGTEIIELPINLSESIEITKNANDIANGTYENIKWSIDANGKLTVDGSGEFLEEILEPTGSKKAAPWSQYSESIVSAKVNLTGTTNAANMFAYLCNLESVDLSGFDTTNVTDMSGMFDCCESLTSLDLSSFDTTNVTDMNCMFNRCDSLRSLDLSNFDTTKVTDMNLMFDGCDSLRSLDLSSFDTTNVTDMSGMFSWCENLESLDISGFNTMNVTDMDSMFDYCKSLTSLDVSGFDTTNVTNMNYMFGYCSSLRSLDVSSFDTTNVTYINGIFEYCSNLKVINTPKNVKISVELPGIWLMSDSTEIIELPMNLNESVRITRVGTVIEEPYITVTKSKTEYNVGDELNLDDITVIYNDGLGTETKVTDYTINAADIDMSTAGEKELIITYNELTQTVKIIVKAQEGSGDADNPGGGSGDSGETDKPENTEGLKFGFVSSDGSLTDTAAYIYTGNAITPAVSVTNNGETLVEGVDYTIKYSNNIKATDTANTAKAVISGKGNFAGLKQTLTFKINKKKLDNSDISTDDKSVPAVEVDTVTVAEGAKASPVITYNGVQLKNNRDFIFSNIDDKNHIWNTDESGSVIILTGNGNFAGDRQLTVTVVSKKQQKNIKIKAAFDKKFKGYTYDGTPQYLGNNLNVYTAQTQAGEAEPLEEGTDYVISYPSDITSAGTKKITITGINKRCMGSVTKSYKITPSKADLTVEYDKDNKGYAYVRTGTKVDDLVVKVGNTVLTEGKDYKVTYSGNKNVGSKAKFTVTGIGNYKGSKAANNKFTINAVVLNNNKNSGSTEGLKIISKDMVFKKAGVYKSAPYVDLDGVTLKKSDYTVSYYLDDPRYNQNPREMNRNNKVTAGDTTVWVKVVGKGNYASEDKKCYAVGSYKVCAKQGESLDLSKAKISFKDSKETAIKKTEYTGNPIDGDNIKVEVTCKVNGQNKVLEENKDYTVEFVNNVNKGKATVIIRGAKDQTTYVGSKTATFSIVAKKL